MSSIRLYPEHGVNPTIPTCFWCGKDKNEVALLGRAFKEKAPMTGLILDYGPCDECEANMARGITLVEAGHPSVVGKPAFAKTGPLSDIAPTGRWLVVTEGALDEIISDRHLLNHVKNTRKAFLTRDVFEMLMPKEEATPNGKPEN